MEVDGISFVERPADNEQDDYDGENVGVGAHWL